MILQKAVTPSMAQAYLDHGFDRVSGWVLNASNISHLTSDKNLRQLHQLDYPNSPFTTGKTIHILHFPSPQATPLVRANPEAMSELFPLPTNGLVRVGDITTPLLWLEHTRLPAGARLWRFTPGESSPTLAGTYNGPAFGWQDETGKFHTTPPTIITGRVGILDGAAYAAEPDYDKTGNITAVTLATISQPKDPEFAETEAGMWAKTVAFDDIDLLFESHVKATYHDLPVRVIERFSTHNGDLARISSLVLDHGANHNAKFDFIEAGVWEATLPWSELSSIEPTQRIAKAWTREEDLTDTIPIQTQPETEPSANTARNTWGSKNEPQVTIKTPDPNNPLASDDLQEIYRDIITEIAKTAPQEADRIEIMGMCVDTNLQIASQAIFDNDVRPLPEPIENIAPHLIKLRIATAKPDRGAWFSAFLSITPNGQFHISLDYDNEPRLTHKLPAKTWTTELKRFPRNKKNIPNWLHTKLNPPKEE